MKLNIDQNDVMTHLRLVRCSELHTNYPKHKELWEKDVVIHFYRVLSYPTNDITSFTIHLDFGGCAMSTANLIEEPTKTKNGLIIYTQNAMYYFEEREK